MDKDNEREARLSLKIPETRHVQVLSYDEHGTRVECHKVDNKFTWCVVNDNGLFLCHYGNNFVRAVGDLAAITNTTDFGFAFHIWE